MIYDDTMEEMSDIVIEVRFDVNGTEVRKVAVVDTGAFSIWMDKTMFKSLNGTLIEDGCAAFGADGKKLDIAGKGYIDFSIWGCKMSQEPIRVMRKLASGLLFGRRFWMRYMFKMDLETMKGCIMVGSTRYEGSLRRKYIEDEEIRAVIEDADVDAEIRGMDLTQFHSTTEMQERLRGVIWKHRMIFKEVGCIKGYKHEIKLVKGAEPVVVPIRRRSPAEQAVEEKMMDKLLQKGIVEHSESEWAANNVFVPKRDGSMRCTTDFRALNSRTVSDQYPMESVRETLDWLASKKVFTAFDLKDGYFQVQLDESSKPYTAVRTVKGLLQYTRLPQGLKNSPAVFQRLVNLVLGKYKGRSVWAFMDDGNIGTIDEESHLEELDEILTCMWNAGMRLKISKCRFGVQEVEVLGHRVTANGLKPSETHITAIRNLKEPQTLTELLRFLGLVNYFATFLPNFTNRAKPLYDVLKDSGCNRKKRWRNDSHNIIDWDKKWGDKQRNAWQDLKEGLCDPNELASPDCKKQKVVMTDASDYGIGGVLLQESNKDEWRPIAFTSRKLKGAEQRYTVTEKECLAVVHALKKWRHYLHGGMQFTVKSDHQALRWLMSLREPKGRLARWMIEVQDYDFVVEYAPGQSMAVADTLSRDSVTNTRCPRCNELIMMMTERERSLPTVEQIKEGQRTEFEDLERLITERSNYVLDEDGLLCLAEGSSMRIIVPKLLIPQVLDYAHGARPNGHQGVWKTMQWVEKRFWWKGWRNDVSERVRKCVNCSIHRLGKPGVQGNMKKWHPLRRFQVVAVDVLEVSTSNMRGTTKAVVMGDLFTRFVWATAVKDERAETISQVLLDEWILRFGPPEKLLSDRGKTFMSEMVQHLCTCVGAKKIFTSPYHPQTDGFIERFNRTLMKDIRAYVSVEENDWVQHLPMACFRYNTAVNSATGMTPYKAVFGVDAFDFDAEAGRRMAIDQEPESNEELARRLAELHWQLIQRGSKARTDAAKQYNKLANAVEFEKGDRVMVYNPRHHMEKGRKLRTPWMGPYIVQEVLTNVSYIVKSEVGLDVARVHVNRLQKYDEDICETGDPIDGVFPDSRRIIKSIIGEKIRDGKRWFKVKHTYANGAEWVSEADLPTLIVAEYDAIVASKAIRSVAK